MWLFLFLSVFVFCYNYAKHTFMPTPLPPPPAPPKIPTGRELYDALMGHIEPELVTDASKLLDEKYKDETPEHHAARMKRYDLAFERYEESYREYMATLDAQVVRYRHQAFAHTELTDRAESDDGILAQLDGFFQTAIS